MTHNVIITDAGFAKDDWTSPISLGLESAQIIEVEAIDVPPALRARSYLYATSFADNSHRFPKLFRWPRLYIGPTHSAFRIFGRLRAKGHIIVDQYAMARRSGFDEVAISTKLAKRQPEEQWLFLAKSGRITIIKPDCGPIKTLTQAKILS